jgi:hypothetical protein
MTDMPNSPGAVATNAPSTAPPQRVALMIDTTASSPLHRITRFHSESPLSMAWVYAAAVLVTFVPLAVAAKLSGVLTAEGPGLTSLHDFTTVFMLLVSLPALLALTLTDQAALAAALRRIQLDGIVTPERAAGIELARRWGKRFERVNVAAYATGVVFGVAVAAVIYFEYHDYPFWPFRDGHIRPGVGHVYLYCMFVFYAAVPLFVFRNVAVSLFLRDVVKKTTVQMLPAHPDRCGGLRPIGHLGLRNQYVLTVYGLNIAALIINSKLYLSDAPLDGLIVFVVIGYLILGPVVFIAPLLAFRGGMLEAKEQLMGEVAQRLRGELERLRKLLPNGTITKEDEDFIERLRKIGAVIDELPVWPFDSRTMQKFLTAYVTPIGAGIGAILIKAFGDKIAHWMHLMR